jgi:hypothetical protein
MAVVSMMRIPGNADELAGKVGELDAIGAKLARKHGALASVVAKTDDGILVVNLWEHEEGRHAMAEEPEVREAVQRAGFPEPAFEGFEVIRHRVFPEAVTE